MLKYSNIEILYLIMQKNNINVQKIKLKEIWNLKSLSSI
jgi:hypothetical protein